MQVKGFAYPVRSQDDEDKLKSYETNNYKPHPCRIVFDDHQEPRDVIGSTFMYAGDAQSLRDGNVDRKLSERSTGMALPAVWKVDRRIRGDKDKENQS